MATFIVLRHGKEIDRVSWDRKTDPDTIRRYLIRNGYPPNIDVRRSYQ